jgi:hypothetical protein
VALPAGKEAPFFSHDGNYRRGWDAYIESLARNGRMTDPDKTWGTVTPHYMTGGVLNPDRGGRARAYDERTVPSRIHERLPDVRLVAILRDPVERAISHHGMVARRGGDRRSFDEAVAQLLQPQALRAARAAPSEATGYIAWGEYGRILDGYLDVFARERLLLLFTDELERAPRELLATLYGFIGVQEDFVPEDVGERYFVARADRGFDWRRPETWLSPSSPVSPQGLQRGLRRVPGARALWNAVPPDARRGLWRPYARAAARTRALNRRNGAVDVQASAAPSDETVERLREHFAEDAARLAAMLGGSVPYWQRPPG